MNGALPMERRNASVRNFRQEVKTGPLLAWRGSQENFVWFSEIPSFFAQGFFNHNQATGTRLQKGG